MLCPNCETPNSDDARFCAECGFPLSGSIARAAGAASPARSRPTYHRPAPPQPAAPSETAPPAATLSRSSQRYQSKRDPLEDAGDSPAFPWASSAEPEPAEEPFIAPADNAAPSEAEAPDEPQTTPVFEGFRSFDGFDDNRGHPGRDGFASAPTVELRDIQEDGRFEGEADDGSFEAFLHPAEDSHGDLHRADTIAFDRGFGKTGVMEPVGSGRPSARSFRAAEPKRRLNGRQIALIVGGIAAVAIALVAVIGFALGFWGGIAVPNVVGMDQAQAESTLEEAGFVPKVMQVKSDEIEGRVLVMDPGAGSFAEEGSEVMIHIATARTIPEVVGEDVEEALRMLSEAGYNNVKQSIEYTDQPEGTVLSIAPEPGTRAKSSMEVSITVAENYKVPDVSGQSQEQAMETVRNAGLSPYVLYIDTDQYPDGTVIGTDPAAGTKVTAEASVAVTVARVRGVELTALAEEMLTPGATVDIGGVSYQIESLDSVSYQGDDTVAFSVTAKPFVTFFGETLFASASQAVSGQIVYNAANEVVSIS